MLTLAGAGLKKLIARPARPIEFHEVYINFFLKVEQNTKDDVIYEKIRGFYGERVLTNSSSFFVLAVHDVSLQPIPNDAPTIEDKESILLTGCKKNAKSHGHTTQKVKSTGHASY